MFNWIKILILRYLLFGLKLSMIVYKSIYLFLDKFIPDRKSETDSDEKQKIYERDDIFSGEKFFDDFWDDDEFMDREVDDFKDILSVCIMMVILIVLIVVLIKVDIRLTEQLGHLTAVDPWAGSL